MSLDSGLLWAFLLVFLRCSATLISSPVFGAQTTPVHIRVMIALALSGALVFAMNPTPPPLPHSLGEMLLAGGNEIACGLLLGAIVSLGITAVQMGASFLDLQVGLGMSQVMNPVTGVPSSILTQFKSMLAVVVFLGIQGHHFVLQAFVKSYEAMPTLSAAAAYPIKDSLTELIGQMCLLALQIAAPVAAVGIIVDVAMGIVNRAVPQMPVFLVGLPVKIIASMVALSVALPMLVFSVQSGVDTAGEHLYRLFERVPKPPAATAPNLEIR